MNSSAFEKILLSAILTSSAVFSVLMVGFMPRRPEPITIDPPDHLESAEAVNQRDVVIRHIGMSIVISVAAGITTAEIIRKGGRSREARLEGRQVFNAQAMLQAVSLPGLSPALALSGDGMTASLSDVSDTPGPSVDRLVSHKQAVSVLAPDRVDAEQPDLPLFLFQPSVPLQSEDVNWFQPLQPEASLDSLPDPWLQATDWQPSQPRLAAREHYQTCRISLPDVPERVLAIFLDGQYYRFVRTAVDREQAFRLALRLDQRGESTVVTDTDERYGVWSLEPDACPEPRAFSTTAFDSPGSFPNVRNSQR